MNIIWITGASLAGVTIYQLWAWLNSGEDWDTRKAVATFITGAITVMGDTAVYSQMAFISVADVFGALTTGFAVTAARTMANKSIKNSKALPIVPPTETPK